MPGRARDLRAEFGDEVGAADQIRAAAGDPAEGHLGGRAGVQAQPYHLGGEFRPGAADLYINGAARMNDTGLRVAEKFHVRHPFRLVTGPLRRRPAPGPRPTTAGAAASRRPAPRWPR